MKKIYSTTNGFVGYHYFLIQAPSHRWDFFQSFFLQNRAQRGWILEAPPWSRPKIEVWPMAIWKKSPRSLGDTELGTNSSLEQRHKSSLSAEKGGKKNPPNIPRTEKKIPRKSSSSLPQSQSYRAYRYRAKQGLASLAASRWNSDWGTTEERETKKPPGKQWLMLRECRNPMIKHLNFRWQYMYICILNCI